MGTTTYCSFGELQVSSGDQRKNRNATYEHKDQIANYIENFKLLVNRYFRFDVPNPPIFVNNIDWIGQMSWIDFSVILAATLQLQDFYQQKSIEVVLKKAD